MDCKRIALTCICTPDPYIKSYITNESTNSDVISCVSKHYSSTILIQKPAFNMTFPILDTINTKYLA